jgi:hypothetical protein
MHGTTTPPIQAVHATHELGHHSSWVSTASEDMAMATVGAGEHVIGTEDGTDAGGTGLLADRLVHDSRNLVGIDELDAGLLEPSDEPHGAIELEPGRATKPRIRDPLVPEWLDWHRQRLSSVRV